MKNDAKPAVTRRPESGVHVSITVGRHTEHVLWTGLEMDVTRGGVFVATYVGLKLGTPVELLIALEGEPHPIAASGVVRWTRAHRDGSDGPAGVGVRFVTLPGEAASKLARFATQVRDPEIFEADEPPMRAIS